MRYVISAAEMKRFDSNTMTRHFLPSAVLMEKAAEAVVKEIDSANPWNAHTALIVCGSGNNGGDGLAVARMLHLKGIAVSVVMAGSGNYSEEAERQVKILTSYDIPLLTDIPKQDFDVIIDAIFGIGLSRDVAGHYSELIRQMNDLTGLKVAVDIASGLDADRGKVLGCCFRADLTVTFGFVKYGHLLYPGREYTGRLAVYDIGITKESFFGETPKGFTYTEDDTKLLPRRNADSNKGTFGKVVSITGSNHMAGAAIFATEAAYRVGAGLVYLYTDDCNRIILQSMIPEAVLKTETDAIPGSKAFTDLYQAAAAMVVGCGMGTGMGQRMVLKEILAHADCPIVLDADALNMIASDEKLKKLCREYKGEAIITPHPGEAARLLNVDIDDVKQDIIGTAQKLSSKYHVICVMKDASTVVTDGEHLYINTSGCSAMAKGGSGDVLAGMIAGVLAQKMKPFEAACASVYLHGLSGEYAAKEKSSYGVLARDILDAIPHVISNWEESDDSIREV